MPAATDSRRDPFGWSRLPLLSGDSPDVKAPQQQLKIDRDLAVT
jgi:hypothetical protein